MTGTAAEWVTKVESVGINEILTVKYKQKSFKFKISSFFDLKWVPLQIVLLL